MSVITLKQPIGYQEITSTIKAIFQTDQDHLKKKIRNNVSLINNVVKEIGTHQLLFSTLWSSISLLNGWRIERGLNDFYQISYDGKRLQIPDYNDFHANSLTFLRSALEADTTGKKVVITHHVPTFKLSSRI